MGRLSMCNKAVTNSLHSLFQESVKTHNCQQFPSKTSFPWPIGEPIKNPLILSSFSKTSPFTVNCSSGKFGDETMSTSSAYNVLGVLPDCSLLELKAAFRAKVKQFHPDVRKGEENSDTMIRCIIQAYEILSNFSKSEIIERECLDPFDKPESEAFDLFVNEFLCVGRGCPYSCVKTAPHAFTYVSSTGTARATSQGHGEDYKVQLAVGQCPRSCIHYVTPSQRVILEELQER